MGEYHPITAEDQSRIHQFGKKVLPGLFLGIRSVREVDGFGNVTYWFADLEDLKTMDASEIYSEKLNAKEVILPKRRRIETLGADQDLKTSISIRHREKSHYFLGESEGSLPSPHDSFSDASEAINDFWSMPGNFTYHHHVEHKVKLYSSREESFPIQLKHIDVTQN